MATNFTDLFSMRGSVVEAPQSVRNTDEYKVSFKDGKGGIYTSVVRFIPYFADIDKNIMQKTVSYVKNPITQQGLYVDDPRTVGQFSPVIDMFFKFYNSGNATLQDFAKKHLSSKPQYAALVQIIQDEQHPELVGQIKVFKFGKKLWEKLYAEEHPAMGQGVFPFHPVYGRYFFIKCTSQSGFNNFDQSGFFDNKDAQNHTLPMGMWYKNPATGQMEVVTENTDQQAVFTYLEANTPDFARYDYQPWTAEQEKHVNETLKIMADYLQTGTLQSNLQAVNTPSPAAPAAGMQMNTNPVFPGASMPTPAAPAAMPSIPAMPSAAPAPAAPAMGNFNMGQTSLGPTPVMPSAAPSVVGIDLPNVQPATAPSNPGVTTLGGSIGNIDDVLSNI